MRFQKYFPVNVKFKKRNSSSSSSNSDEEQGSTDRSYSLLIDQSEAEDLKIPQSWQLLNIKAYSKSWEDLNSSKKTEQEIVQMFQTIKPEDFEINGQFPGSRNTLLHEASNEGKPIVLEKLLTYEPDVNIQNKKGETPIMSLVEECRKRCGKLNFCEKHFSCFKMLMGANANLKTKNNAGLTVLSYASMCSEKIREKYLKELLHINEKKNFATGLYQALESKLDIQFLEELNRICRDYKINEQIQEFMFEKHTFLQIVCEYGMQESAKRLLELGANPDFTPLMPNRPIQLACMFSQPEILQILIEKNPRGLNLIKTKSERNLLHSAVKKPADLEGAHECLKILLQHKNEIDINEIDKYKRTPLHYAVLHDRDECAVELLNHGAKIDEEDEWKHTPLMRISKSAFEKYLDGMILDGKDETNLVIGANKTEPANKNKAKTVGESKIEAEDESNVEVEGESKIEVEGESKTEAEDESKAETAGEKKAEEAGESREKQKSKKKTSKKRAKESRTIIFDFSNLFRKTDEVQKENFKKSEMTQSDLCYTRQNTNVSIEKDYYSFSTDLLIKIKNTKRLETLIEHPVLSIIIYFKWFHVRAIFYIYLALYFLFCLLFTLYIYLTEDNPVKIIPTNSNSFKSRPLNIISTIITIKEADTKIYLIIPILIIISIFLFFEASKFGQKKLKYLRDMDNILRLTVIMFAIFVMVCLNTNVFSPYCPHLKAISILLTWFELFLVVGKYPELSYYVSIFRSASINLFKFLSVHMILLIGFALSFHTLFRSSVTDNMFTYFFSALFKTIVMLTAEFDASNIPFDEYPIVSHIIFLVYIFIITIVLLNLMIAIAFKQVKKMEKNRHFYGSLAQIDYIKHFEDNFSDNIVITLIYKMFSLCTDCITCSFMKKHESYDVTLGEITLEVLLKGNNHEFKNILVFEGHPTGKVRTEQISKKKDSDKKWYKDFNLCGIFKTCHQVHSAVIENAQEILSKRFCKKEELKKDDSSSKTDFEIVRSELIELRRFIQACFDKKEGKTED